MNGLKFAVLGDPVGHSLSPAMYGAAFAHLGLPHTYEAIRTPPDRLPLLLDRVRRGELGGVNVTVPLKTAVLSLVDLFTDDVGATRAINTAWVDPTGRLVGTNTDVDGFRADLLALGVVPKRVLIFGAGGAARACVYAASKLVASAVGSIDVGSRKPEQAQKLAQELGLGRAVAWPSASERSGEPYDLVVNATSAGMAGAAPGDGIAEAFEHAPRTADVVAYDLVYRPADTPFLVRARALGARGHDGLGMLVEQGVRALSIFLATPIDETVKQVMRDAASSALSGAGG